MSRLLSARTRIAQPDDVEVTLSLTMSVARWKQLRAQLVGTPARNGWPASVVDIVIREALDKLLESHEATVEFEQ